MEDRGVSRFDHAITLTSVGLQGARVANVDAAARVLNKPLFLQLAGRFGEPFSAHPQAVGQLLLCEQDRCGARAVGIHQQPATESFFDMVVTTAGQDL